MRIIQSKTAKIVLLKSDSLRLNFTSIFKPVNEPQQPFIPERSTSPYYEGHFLNSDWEEIRRSLDLNDILDKSRNVQKVENEKKNEIKEKEEEITEAKPCTEGVLHPIGKTETLQGISLKYGLTVHQIKSVNKLWSNDAFLLRKTIILPIEMEQYEAANRRVVQKSVTTGNRFSHLLSMDPDDLIREFVREFHCSPEIAGYYLELKNFNYQQATKRFLKEREQQKPLGESGEWFDERLSGSYGEEGPDYLRRLSNKGG